MINIYNEDCLQAMLKMDTDQYDLAIVDPPYGIKRAGHKEYKNITGKHTKKKNGTM